MTRFFILGCQRSGTTLLRLILDSHPDIVCCDEEIGYSAIENDLPVTELTGGSTPALIGFKLPIWTELFAEYESFTQRFGADKILFLERDVHQVVASMLTLPGFLDAEVPTVQGWLRDPSRSFTRFCNGFDVSALVPPLAIDQKLQLAARYWAYKRSSIRGIRQRGFATHRVRYQDLVEQPAATLRDVVQFLGIPWHEDLLSHHRLPHDELNRDGTIGIGDINARRAIDCTSLEKYKQVLTVDQTKWLSRWEREYA